MGIMPDTDSRVALFLGENGGKEFCPLWNGPLAQLAEQLTLNQQVQGSIPWRLTK